MLIAILGTALLAASALQEPSPQVADTARPVMPYDVILPAGDTLIVVTPPAEPGMPTPEYFRTVFIVLFRADAPGVSVREVLQRYRARLVGGLRGGGYIIEVPDPGASYKQYERFRKRLKAESVVDLVMPYESRPIITTDGVGCRPAGSSADTSRPAIPPTGPFPADSTMVVGPPGDTVTLFYRNLLGIRFDDSTSGATIRSLFTRYQAEVIGGLTNAREYIVRLADPGPTYAAFDSLADSINSEPGVMYAAPVSHRSGYGINVHFPEDRPIEVTSDTTPPRVPTSLLALPDTLVRFNYLDDPDDVYFRNAFFRLFDDSTSGTTINCVLRRYQAEIIGGSPSAWDRGAFIVRVPDPGTSMQGGLIERPD